MKLSKNKLTSSGRGCKKIAQGRQIPKSGPVPGPHIWSNNRSRTYTQKGAKELSTIYLDACLDPIDEQKTEQTKLNKSLFRETIKCKEQGEGKVKLAIKTISAEGGPCNSLMHAPIFCFQNLSCRIRYGCII